MLKDLKILYVFTHRYSIHLEYENFVYQVTLYG